MPAGTVTRTATWSSRRCGARSPGARGDRRRSRRGAQRRMKPQGSLAEHDFPTLVQDLSRAALDRRPHPHPRRRRKSVTVQDGRLVFASSSSPDERLGALLLRRGRITLRQLADAAAAVAPGKRLGTVLVEQGVLTPKDLDRRGGGAHAGDHLRRLPVDGGPVPPPGGRPSPEAITLKISTPDLILEGIRRIDSWSRIDRAVGGLDARYERAPAYDEVDPRDERWPRRRWPSSRPRRSPRAWRRSAARPAARLRGLPHAVGLPRDRPRPPRRRRRSRPRAELEDESLGIVVPEE